MPSSLSSPCGPDATCPHPLAHAPQVGFLKPLISNPLIEVGDYSYYDDPNGPERFEAENVLYHYDFLGDRLIIGKFCAIGQGATFIMNGANHLMDGFSTYPFAIFGKGWDEGFDPSLYKAHSRGDTLIGDDVWIGRNAIIMPGVSIGSGAIIGSHAVVASDIPAYGVVVGNPAQVVRMRFEDDIIDRLMALSWWDWPPALITQAIPLLNALDLDGLASLSCKLLSDG